MHLESRDVSVFWSKFIWRRQYLFDKFSQLFPNLQKNTKIIHKFADMYLHDLSVLRISVFNSVDRQKIVQADNKKVKF